jgi:hypothetical protein
VAFSVFFDNLFSRSFSNLEALAGAFLDLEAALCLKLFFNSFGCYNINLIIVIYLIFVLVIY